MPPKKNPPGPVKNQQSILSCPGVTSEVFPSPVDEKAFPDAKNFVSECNAVLVGQMVHV